MITFTSLVGEAWCPRVATRPPAQLVPPRWSSTLDLLSRCRAPSRCLDAAKKPTPKRQLLELSPIISRHPYLSPSTLCMFYKLRSNTCERKQSAFACARPDARVCPSDREQRLLLGLQLDLLSGLVHVINNGKRGLHFAPCTIRPASRTP